MNKTFEVINNCDGDKKLIAYENSRRVLEIIIDDSSSNIVCKVLEALGYRLLYRAL